MRAGVLSLAILASASCVAIASESPTFEQYPVKVVALQKPASVKLSSREAKRFRTVLRDGAQSGPNFAGHYTVVAWGCGTACQNVAIVDATNGHVTFPRQLQPLSNAPVTDNSPPLQYRLDSSLLIVTGAPMDGDDEGEFYYRWNGRTLKQIQYVRKNWER